MMESNLHYKESIFAHCLSGTTEESKQFLLDLKELKSQEPYIHNIQFEEFVLNEEYRNSIAETIGLDLMQHRGNIFFRSGVSGRIFIIIENTRIKR